MSNEEEWETIDVEEVLKRKRARTEGEMKKSEEVQVRKEEEKLPEERDKRRQSKRKKRTCSQITVKTQDELDRIQLQEIADQEAAEEVKILYRNLYARESLRSWDDWDSDLGLTGRGFTLIDHLDEDQIEDIYKEFVKSPTGTLSPEEFLRTLREKGHMYPSDKEFEVLFLRVDINRNGHLDWDELVSHILLEFQEKEMQSRQLELRLPLEGTPRLLRTRHRLPVCRVAFYPSVAHDRTTSFMVGKYVTVSRDGMIHYWSLDFELEDTVFSECPSLKVQPTWVTDLAVMPDVSIICTSNTERDLRFYDVTSQRFDLRMNLTSWEHAIVTMHYRFDVDIEVPSLLILGDAGGHVRILMFSSKSKGPFYHSPGHSTKVMRYEAVLKGEMKGMRLVEFKGVHSDWVRQVSYYISLKSFISCAACADHSLFLCDVMGTKTQYGFNVAKGVNCFSFAEETRLIVTGSADCLVRVWNVFVPGKAICVFQGHHAAIVSIVLQDAGQRVFSLSKDKCLKVWDLASQSCIQTYIGLPSELGERTSLTVLYNPLNKNLVVASMKLAVVVLGYVIHEDRTDGVTHTRPVTKALYNSLFKCLVTVGMDSTIMVWDPWTGKRMFMLRSAHTKSEYGENRPVEITAATFDPTSQLLLTGARDGSLKVWNFNTGVCVRKMKIEPNCEVTGVIWLQNRILAVGWNRHVVEFADKGISTFGRLWETRHTDDVLCAACRMPQTLATSSYNGELILWRLETGQAYRRFQVSNPMSKILLTYRRKSKCRNSSDMPRLRRKRPGNRQKASRKTSIKESEHTTAMAAESRKQSQMHASRSSARDGDLTEPEQSTDAVSARASLSSSRASSVRVRKARKVSVIQMPPSGTAIRPLSVHAMLFLESRPMRPDIGTLLVALENGNIQVWSHHATGGYLTQFLAIHMAGDYVISMSTDQDNEFLLTGTTMGYLKVWLMVNYAIPGSGPVSMPQYRLTFPFLWRDRIEGRAKRCLREQRYPVLLSSHQAHLRSINHVEYLNEGKIIITSSSDASVRLWTLGGRYIGTLGTYRMWPMLHPDRELSHLKFRVPPELSNVASSTTMKVLKGGDVPLTHMKLKEDVKEIKVLPEHLIQKVVIGKRLSEPILGNHFQLPPRSPAPPIPKLESNTPFVPVYCHLAIAELDEIELRITKGKITT